MGVPILQTRQRSPGAGNSENPERLFRIQPRPGPQQGPENSGFPISPPGRGSQHTGPWATPSPAACSPENPGEAPLPLRASVSLSVWLHRTAPLGSLLARPRWLRAPPAPPRSCSSGPAGVYRPGPPGGARETADGLRAAKSGMRLKRCSKTDRGDGRAPLQIC